MTMNYEYKVGGSLGENAPSYVVRQADSDFYHGLKAGEFCYVFNSRQMGKTSLIVRTREKLEAEGFACAYLDVSVGGSRDIRLEQWYAGIIYKLVTNFNLGNASEFLRHWWREREEIAPVQRLEEFIQTVLLASIPSKIIIFIDEIDSILSLGFSTDDFFALIRSCYEKRNFNQEYQRLAFALVGVATPSDLIADKRRTPFNIGRAIQLDGFKESEIEPLAKGFEGKVENPLALMREVLAWTGGQPFLTQKVCQLILQEIHSHPTPHSPLPHIIRSQIIENWESYDEPEHLKTIRNRMLLGEQVAGRFLGWYQQILLAREIAADESLEQMRFRLTGLVVKQQDKLQVYNQIYASVFNLNWVEKELGKLRPYSESFNVWVESNYQDESRLLRGQALQDALIWADGKSLSNQDSRYLAASQKLERKEAENALSYVKKQARRILSFTVVGAIISLVFAGFASQQALHKTEEAKQAQKQSETTKMENNQLVLKNSQLVQKNQQGEKNFRISQYQLEKIIKQKKEAEKKTKSAEDNFLVANAKAVKAENKSREAEEKLTIVTKQLNKNQKDVELATTQAQAAKRNAEQAKKDADTAKQNLDVAKQKEKTAQEAVITAKNQLNQAQIARGEALKQQKEAQEGTKLEQEGVLALRQFEFQELQALVIAMDAGQKLKEIVKERPLEKYPTTSPILALQTILDNIHEQNQLTIVESLDVLGQLLGEQPNKASFCPGKHRILTVSDDLTAKLWDGKGNLLVNFQDQDRIGSANCSVDGKRIITASPVDGDVKLWDEKGNLLADFKKLYPFFPRSISFSPDGQRILVASGDIDVKVFNLNGNVLAHLKGNLPYLNSAIFSTDGQRIVTVSRDGTAKFWDSKGNWLFDIKEYKHNILSFSFSPDGQSLVTTSGDTTAKVWNSKGNWLFDLKGHQGSITSVSFSPSGQYIVTASSDRTAKVWDSKGKLLADLKGHPATLNSASFSPDEQLIITASDGRDAKIWNIKNNLLSGSNWLFDLKGNQKIVYSANFSPDGKYIVTTSHDNTAKVWDMTGKLLTDLRHKDSVFRASFSPDGKHIVTSLVDTGVVWDSQGKLLFEFKGDIARFSPDGQYIITASRDGTAVWDMKGRLFAENMAKNQAVVSRFSFGFSRDGKYFVTTYKDGSAKIWDIKENLLADLKGHKYPIQNANFSPDGQLIVTASLDGTAKIWDIKGKLLADLKGHQAEVNSAEFSPDGHRVVTASSDRTVKIWDIKGNLLADLKGHQAGVNNASFSPDGKHIVTASNDGTAKIWKVENLDDLLVRGCNWLEDYLATRPDVRERLKVCK